MIDSSYTMRNDSQSKRNSAHVVVHSNKEQEWDAQ